MSVKAKRLFKRLISYAGLFFFAVAAVMLWWQLRNYSIYDIAHTMLNIPFMNLVMACCACLAGYFALSLYDFLALNYVGEAKKVVWWKWMLAGMLGFAISNNAGHAVVSGGAIRYRLYTRWRIRGGDIVKMLTISGITYTLGCAAIFIIGYFLIPAEFFEQSTGANIGFTAIFIGCIAAIVAYFAATVIFHKKTIKIGKLNFDVPTTKMAALQMLLGVVDGLLAGLVLYSCLRPFWDIPFGTYIGFFIIAQNTGVFSQVPGGIGVFESIFLIALPDNVDKAAVFGALLAYRIIYYVLPLIGIGGLFFIYERWLRVHIKRILAEAKEKMDTVKDKLEHIPRPHMPRKHEEK
jgi:phosphatidylglycerol lysyltransferase